MLRMGGGQIVQLMEKTFFEISMVPGKLAFKFGRLTPTKT